MCTPGAYGPGNKGAKSAKGSLGSRLDTAQRTAGEVAGGGTAGPSSILQRDKKNPYIDAFKSVNRTLL